MLKEEVQLLQEPGSYAGEVVKVMGKTKVLVKENIEHNDEEMFSDNIGEGSDDTSGEDDGEELDSADEAECGEGEQTDCEEEDPKEKDDSQKDSEMAELEKEYMELRNQEQDILRNLKRHKDDDILKGQAVKNQKAIWDRILELRFLLQKAFNNSNRLPQELIKSSFCNSDEVVSVAYSELISSSKRTMDSLMELQEALLNNNPTICQPAEGNSGRPPKHSEASNNSNSEVDEEWQRMVQLHRRVVPFRNKSIDKWQRKTQVATGSAAIKNKLQAFNQNISDQVASYMRDPSRMIKQMRMKRSNVGVFGDVSEDTSCVDVQKVQTDGDPELLDDAEFYQQLLKEFFETIDPTSSETALYTLQKMQPKKRKVVDRRASKSRKIRYNVHEKIVNFMAPQPMNLPPMAPKLFENLFGLRT